MSNTLETLESIKNALELLQKQTNGTQQSTVAASSDVSANAFYTQWAQAYIDFTYENPTIYHVVDYASRKLTDAGFKYISEKSSWDDLTHGKYFTTRNGTSLVAFALGKNWKPENGIGAVGSHIDSLTAKLKPVSVKHNVEGYELLGVAPYSGALSDVWFDRDLGVGGRVLVREGDKIEARLLDSTPQPIARIPTLAPHFGAPAVGPFDKEDQVVPVVSYTDGEEPEATEDEKRSPLFGKHSLQILRYVANKLNVKVSQLLAFDLDLFDTQKGVIGGIKNDFIFAPRVDDRLCSFCNLHGLIEFANGGVPEGSFSLTALYDNEEVGSQSRQGAQGGLMEAVVERVTVALFDETTLTKTAYANSIIISADVSHMHNPNFNEVYGEGYRPKPNTGIVVCLDSNNHMATDVVGTAFIEELGRLNDDKIQRFMIKNNSRSGGTIGPYVASQTGARTVDLGVAQWAMHSIRASFGSKDVALAIKFFKGYFNNNRRVLDTFGDL